MRRLKGNSLATNTTWMFLGQGLRNVLRALYFLIIPRYLGPEQYGAFIGVTALIAILAPFASWGIGYLLVKNVARDHSVFADYWGNTLFVSILSGLALIGFAIAVSPFFLPRTIPWSLIIIVAFADLLFTRILDNACLAFQAFDMLGYTAKLNVLASVLRLIAAVVLVVMFRQATALTWGWFYLFSAIISCLVGVVWVQRKLGTPILALHRIKPELAEGFFFSASLSSQTIYNDIDKTMMAKLSTLDATGIYGAAYRLIEVAILPVRSLLSAAYASFFRHGSNGVAATARYAKKLLPRATAYSFLISFAMFFGAPMIPYFLGHEYARSVEALRWLAPLPVLKTIHSFIADSLTGAGFQGLRTAVQVVIAVFNVLINLWLIPAYSWRGAAWSSLASDGLLAVALWMLMVVLVRRETNRGATVVPGQEQPELVGIDS